MIDSMEDRKKAHESVFKKKEDIRFKAEARRNKLLGHWLAEAFGITGEAADAYAKEVVIADLEEPGIEDVMRKVMADIERHGVGISDPQVRAKIDELDDVAFDQVCKEEGIEC